MFKIGDVVHHAVDGLRGRVVGIVQTREGERFDVSWEHGRRSMFPLRAGLLRSESEAAAAGASRAAPAARLVLAGPPAGSPAWSYWIRTRGY